MKFDIYRLTYPAHHSGGLIVYHVHTPSDFCALASTLIASNIELPYEDSSYYGTIAYPLEKMRVLEEIFEAVELLS
jgi:hypothetical protein